MVYEKSPCNFDCTKKLHKHCGARSQHDAKWFTLGFSTFVTSHWRNLLFKSEFFYVLFTSESLSKIFLDWAFNCNSVSSYLRRHPQGSWYPSWPWRRSGVAASNTDVIPPHEGYYSSWETVPETLEWCSLLQGCSGPLGYWKKTWQEAQLWIKKKITDANEAL